MSKFSFSAVSAIKTIAGLLTGAATVRQTNRMLRSMRIAFIALAAVCIITFVCLLVITTYVGIQIVQSFP